VARSNYGLYTTTGITLDTGRFGTINNWKPHRGWLCTRFGDYRYADIRAVVKSQEEALSGDVKYAFCLICTKCLPDVIPTTELVADCIKSGRIGAWSLIQVCRCLPPSSYRSGMYTIMLTLVEWLRS
jgi:2-dehydropantoate 2-reductase